MRHALGPPPGAFRMSGQRRPPPDSLDPTAHALRVQTKGATPMALASRIQDNAPRRRPSGNPCSVQVLLDELPTDESAAFQFMMDDGWSQERIYAELKDEGHEVGKQTINRHRAKSCRCFL